MISRMHKNRKTAGICCSIIHSNLLCPPLVSLQLSNLYFEQNSFNGTGLEK